MAEKVCFFCPWENFANFVISRPGAASDHKKDFKNEKFRRFAIGAVYHFFSCCGLSEKLWGLEVKKFLENEKFCLFLITRLDPQGSSPPFGGLPSRAPQSCLYKYGFWVHKTSWVYWFFDGTFSGKVLYFFGTQLSLPSFLTHLKRRTSFWTTFQKTEWFLRL